MAITTPYATPQQYRDALSLDRSDDDAAIRRNLETAARYIDQRLGRHFSLDTSAVARVFIPGVAECVRSAADSRLLYLGADIGDAATVTITIDDDGDDGFGSDTALASTDYELRPINAALGPEPRPYTEVYLLDSGTRAGWVLGRRVQIQARYGWPSVPQGITEGCIQIAALIRAQGPRALWATIG